MEWTETHIKGVIADLAEEDFFACRALFRIARVEFTDKVPTLAVSLSASPRLYVNLGFLNAHARSEDDVKAVLMHEFLHVVLQHTEKFKSNTLLLNVALDAVINSIIHRTYGERYSDFFKRFYKPNGLEALLRPWGEADEATKAQWQKLHTQVYTGAVAADDLYELFRSLARTRFVGGDPLLIGNHEDWIQDASEENREMIEGILKRMDGTRIWNKPKQYGVSDLEELERRRIRERSLREWRRDTRRLLEQCLRPDPAKSDETVRPVQLPILSPGDRRAFAMLGVNGFIPFAEHRTVRRKPSETVNVYLDVSGSMSEEIDRLLLLLTGFKDLIRRPLWAFSNVVEPAVFRNGTVEYKSTGGTGISCVFDHIRENGFRRSLIVTDGYVEAITPQMLSGVPKEGLRVLLSATGQAAAFERHGISYHQLKNLNI